MHFAKGTFLVAGVSPMVVTSHCFAMRLGVPSALRLANEPLRTGTPHHPRVHSENELRPRCSIVNGMRKPFHDSSLVYGRPTSGFFFTPFTLKIEPMERLLLLNFGRDPNYKGIELQAFDDPVHGQGMLVIMYRQDRQVDVYYEPGLKPHKRGYEIEAGLAEWVEASMERSRFEITSHGAQVDLAFDDAAGRRIALMIREQEGGRPRKPFPLLAPISSGIEDPQRFLMIFLNRFYLVRRSGTGIAIRISEATRNPRTLPVPIDGARVYFAHYSPEPFIAEWNTAHDGPLAFAQPPGMGEFNWGGTIFTLVENAGRFETAKITAADDKHQAVLTFSPPFPDIACLKHGAATYGDFALTVDEVHDVCAGQYWLSMEDDRIYITLDIVKGWRPRSSKCSMRLLFSVLRFFKNWPKTYKWSAQIKVEGEALIMQSGWSRK
jgi:hypothetical protein